MATFSSITIPAGKGTRATLAATTASGTITIGKTVKFAFDADQICTIVFYPAANAIVPSATVGFQIPANTIAVFDLGNSDSFAIFNTSASTANYSYQQLATSS